MNLNENISDVVFQIRSEVWDKIRYLKIRNFYLLDDRIPVDSKVRHQIWTCVSYEIKKQVRDQIFDQIDNRAFILTKELINEFR